jgi:acyl-CoA dehydrogenase
MLGDALRDLLDPRLRRDREPPLLPEPIGGYGRAGVRGARPRPRPRTRGPAMPPATRAHRQAAYGAMPDASGLNFYDADPALAAMLRRRLAPAYWARTEELLREAGAVAGGELDRLAREAERNPPRLVAFNARGERIDEVEYHPSYRAMERIAFGRFALAAMAHRPVLGFSGPAPHVVKYALSYVLVQSEFGLFCPVNMTDSLARVLRLFGDARQRQVHVARLTETDVERLHQGAMFLTEKAGGSDVGASESVARRVDGGWALWGEKWFCSNVSADLILTLARPAGGPAGTRGLGLFLVPRRLPDGGRNRYRINRLKDKLGTRDMATGEVTFEGAIAEQVGELERGFVQMMEMVNSSRLSNAMRAAGLTRRGYLEALVTARGRMAFGAPLAELPLMRETLVELMLDGESALAAVLHAGAVFDRADAGDAGARRLLRVLTPLAKFSLCKRARWSTGEAMEARGGNGYIEEWVNARLVRDAHLGSIWEGSSNVIALDVLRAVERDDADGALFADIEERLAAVRDPLVRRAAALASRALERVRGVVARVREANAPEREAAMGRLAERLARLWAASLLIEQADPVAAAPGAADMDAAEPDAAGLAGAISYRPLIVAGEYLRRRLLVPEGEVWLGPRPAAGEWFEPVVDHGYVPAAAAVPLLAALESAARG